MKALVTGDARGIGATIGERLAVNELHVVTLDRAPRCDFEVDLGDRGPLPPEVTADVDVCVSNAAIATTIASARR